MDHHMQFASRCRIVAGWLLINTVMSNPGNSLVGMGLIALGLPVYYYLTNRKEPVSEGEGSSSPEDDER